VLEVRLGSYRAALGEVLVELGRELRDLVVLDADTPKSTGSATFAEAFPERFINVGISEQDLVSMAAGLAMGGKVPVATAFAAFLMRAWEQVRNTVARMGLNVKLVGTHAGLSAHLDGASHQVLEDLALMRALPNTTVIAPADTEAVKELVRQAVTEVRGPTYVRLGRDNAIPVYGRGEVQHLRVGHVNVVEDGEDAVIFAHGPMVGVALAAARILKRDKGLSVGVVDAHTIQPLDTDAVVKLAKRANLAVTLEEHRPVGGLGSAVAEVLTSFRVSTPLLRLGVGRAFGASARSYWDLLRYAGLSPEEVARGVGGALT